MYQTSISNATPNGTKNRMAFMWLRQMGFPASNIRRAFSKLTDIKHISMAERHGLSRLTISKTIAGERQNRKTQEIVAWEFNVPVDEMFPPDEPRFGK